MSNYLPDSVYEPRPYCPTCEPNADPVEEMLAVRWCGAHNPSWAGVEDDSVQPDTFLLGGIESGGDDNRAFCDWLHRGKIRQRG